MSINDQTPPNKHPVTPPWIPKFKSSIKPPYIPPPKQVSQPKRYTVTIPAEVWEMSMRDAEKLAQVHKECVRLAAENERLRKAGDNLAVAWARVRTDYHTWDTAVKTWDAAKEWGAK